MTEKPIPIAPDALKKANAELAERDGFLTPPNSWPISPALAAQLHYHPKLPKNVSVGDPEGNDQ